MAEFSENSSGPKTKKFRINRKKVGLTYSCPTDAEENPIESKEALLDFLEKQGGHCQYVVSKELHESGKKHYHAYVHYDNKLDTQDPRFFDFSDVHPNIINPGAGWISYCKKEKEFITNIEVNPFTAALACDTVDDAMDFLWQKRPQCMALNGDRIEKNMAKRMRILPPKPGNYFGPWRWPMLENIQSVVLIGPSNIGKTQYAKAHFNNPLFVSHKDRLRDFEPGTHDGIIFDDMDFNHYPRTAQIHLTDWDEDRDLDARYMCAKIPANTRKIFTCNTMCVDNRDEAIARRITVINLK